MKKQKLCKEELEMVRCPVFRWKSKVPYSYIHKISNHILSKGSLRFVPTHFTPTIMETGKERVFNVGKNRMVFEDTMGVGEIHYNCEGEYSEDGVEFINATITFHSFPSERFANQALTRFLLCVFPHAKKMFYMLRAQHKKTINVVRIKKDTGEEYLIEKKIVFSLSSDILRIVYSFL